MLKGQIFPGHRWKNSAKSYGYIFEKCLCMKIFRGHRQPRCSFKKAKNCKNFPLCCDYRKKYRQILRGYSVYFGSWSVYRGQIIKKQQTLY